MVKYVLFNIFSFGSLIWQLMLIKIYALNMTYNPLYFDFIPPALLSYAGGLFLIQKTKRGGLISLIGLSIMSRPVLINWFGLLMRETENIVFLICFLIASTLFLFFLGFLSVQAIVHPDKKILEINYYPKRSLGLVLGGIPFAALTIYIIMHLWTQINSLPVDHF